MLDSFTNYFWQHPIAIAIAAIAVIIILVWMTGSGSRQRFVTFKRTKETDQLARDLSRIAAALEKIARQREIPVDYLDRPIPHGWEESISAGDPTEDAFGERQEEGQQEVQEMPADAEHGAFTSPGATTGSSPKAARAQAAASGPANSPATPNALVPPSAANAPREPAPPRRTNPLGGTADLLGGKRKLDLPNPLYRPKR